MMKWEEKNRTDGKGVYYETSTPGGTLRYGYSKQHFRTAMERSYWNKH